MRLAVRILSICLVFVVTLFVLKSVAFAQTTAAPANQVQPNLAPNTDSDVPMNLHTFSQTLMLEIMSSLACNLSGHDPLNPTGLCLGLDPTTGKIGYVKSGGAIGALASMIAVLYTPPIHTGDYIAYLRQNFGLAKPTYAQTTGIGFTGLAPLLNAWVVFRNIVYLLFVFVFVIIGLAIMLRVRIDPRTVMTIQNQIPKIIISLILVTFSFAIAGFLIDIMWVSIYFIANVMGQADSTGAITSSMVATNIYQPAPAFANNVLGGGVLGGIHNIAFAGASAIAQLIHDFISPATLPNPVPPTTGNPSCGGLALPFACIDPVGFIGGAVAGLVTDLGGIISTLISYFVGILAYLILIIALLWALLRLWFALIRAYISILVDVIFAPFWIVAGLIPGQNSAGFGGWLRDIGANLAAFPAAITMFLLARLFTDSFVASTTLGTDFIPPLLGSDAASYIANLIAIGVVLATPGVVEMTKKAFKAPKIELGAFGAAIGVGAGGARLVGTAGKVAADPFRRQEEGGGNSLGAKVRSLIRNF